MDMDGASGMNVNGANEMDTSREPFGLSLSKAVSP
jgi:hypothetical protein